MATSHPEVLNRDNKEETPRAEFARAQFLLYHRFSLWLAGHLRGKGFPVQAEEHDPVRAKHLDLLGTGTSQVPQVAPTAHHLERRKDLDEGGRTEAGRTTVGAFKSVPRLQTEPAFLGPILFPHPEHGDMKLPVFPVPCPHSIPPVSAKSVR
ncbi:MAG: hypothetical protein QXU79_03790 [Candidatus Micrarchaeaceae archaeon]